MDNNLQMKFTAAAATSELWLLCLSSWLIRECSAKTFQLAQSSVHGNVLCATSTATETTSVNDLPALTFPVPPQVHCGKHCTSQTACHSFNYRSDTNNCEFYHSPPTVCQPVPQCEYFQVCTDSCKLFKPE